MFNIPYNLGPKFFQNIRHLPWRNVFRTMCTLRSALTPKVELPAIFPLNQIPSRLPIHSPLDQISSRLPFDFPRPVSIQVVDFPPFTIDLTEPISEINTPMEAKNDVKTRRKKMKKHLKQKWNKTHQGLIKKLALQRERKEELKLQQLFSFWRQRSEAWDPKDKIQHRLHLARRSGYYVDILNTRGSPLSKSV